MLRRCGSDERLSVNDFACRPSLFWTFCPEIGAASYPPAASSEVWWARSRRPAFSLAIWRIISTPHLEILVCLEYNVARTVARKGGGKPADRKSDCPGVSTCLRGCYVPKNETARAVERCAQGGAWG